MSRSIEEMKPDKLGKTIAPSEKPGLPRVNPNWHVVQPNSLEIKLKGSNIDELLKELTQKLSETTISKDHIGNLFQKKKLVIFFFFFVMVL